MAPLSEYTARLTRSKRFASTPNLGIRARGISAPLAPALPSDVLHTRMDVKHPDYQKLVQLRTQANKDEVALSTPAAASSSKADTEVDRSSSSNVKRRSIRRSWSESDLDKLANVKRIVNAEGVDFEILTPPLGSPELKPKKSHTFDVFGGREIAIKSIVRSATVPVSDTVRSLKDRMPSISDLKKKWSKKVSVPATPPATKNIHLGGGAVALPPELAEAKRQVLKGLGSPKVVETSPERKVITNNRILTNQASVDLNSAPPLESTTLPVPDALKAFMKPEEPATTKQAESKLAKHSSIASTTSTDTASTRFSNPFSEADRPRSFIGNALSPRPQSRNYAYNLRGLFPLLSS